MTTREFFRLIAEFSPLDVMRMASRLRATGDSPCSSHGAAVRSGDVPQAAGGSAETEISGEVAAHLPPAEITGGGNLIWK